MKILKTLVFALSAVLCLAIPAQAQKNVAAQTKTTGAKATKTAKDKKTSKTVKVANNTTAKISGKKTNTSGKTASVEAKTDTVSLSDFSYCMGIAQTQGLKQYLSTRLNVDTTKMDDFLRGVKESLDKSTDKSLGAYAAGVQIGQQLMTQILSGMNKRITDTEAKYIDETQYKQGILAGITGENLKVTPDSALNTVQNQMEFYHARLMEQKYGKNREEGEKFLAENAKKEGVKTLPNSKVQYKIIKEGTGEKPVPTSKVKVNYEGKLIDGTVFDSSYKRNQPATFECDRVIPGWTQALTNMPVGSTWEIYIPQELGYGSQETGGKIPPFSTLIFKVELLSIEK